MSSLTKLSPLSSEENQQIHIAIKSLGKCRTRCEFNQLLEERLIPLLNCCGVFYVHLGSQQSKPQLIDHVCHPSLCYDHWQQLLKFTLQTSLSILNSTNNTSRLTTRSFCYTEFSCQHCVASKNCYQVNPTTCTIIALFDTPKPTIALYFCRLSTQEQEYNPRDCKLLKLVHSTLLQTLKAIIFQEQYQNMQQMIALLYHGNGAFNNSPSNSPKIYSLLSEKLSLQTQEIASPISPYLTESINLKNGSDIYAPHNHLPSIKSKTSEADHFSQILKQLKQLGLSKRELEVTELIYQGLSTRDISTKLNLSYHTVRNHIKHIYTKVEVSSRSELLTLHE